MKNNLLRITALAFAVGATFSIHAAQPTLAKHHSDMLGCDACHTKPIKVSDSETHENASCVSCHGGLEDLAEPGHANHFDPHASHLGTINCTSCHTGHAEPQYVCNDCHSFEHDDMPFANTGKERKPAFTGFDQDKIEQAIAKGPKESVDVVVIGAGSAGFNAAISAHEAGANVILLEKHMFSGGNSMLAAGGYNATGTPLMEKKGIKDSVDWFVEDALKGGRGANDVDLVRVMGEQSADGIAWLESLGADMGDLKRSGGARVDRTHRPSDGASVGPHIVETLRNAANKRNIETRVNSRAEKVLRDENGKISGVVVHGKHSGYYLIEAKAVVMATGGFGYNEKMFAEYRPQFAGMSSSNNVTATGDGLKLAEEVGAGMVDIEWVQAHPTIGKGSRILVSETVRGVGAIMVNVNGKRYVNELTTRDKASQATLKEPEQYSWLVMDEQLLKKSSMIRGYKDLGMMVEANTIEELAKQTGMKPEVLSKTVADYNRYRENGKDEEFGRDNMPVSITQAPYYAVAVNPGVHHTMGGISINTSAQVKDDNGKVIPGLFAAGEATGGVHGHNRLGGNAIADTVVFGRIAGDSAAAYVAD
ncbi:flavocytochrome c [Ferrimonas marina]|uniref:Fumarate reductase n=1 Tax=Ferrimonas marina TaxID=299255 RepID=A0A1M5VT70_9GAMM|nr:flavocytochrome c [Ferrimonas marina]SHH78388.1 fumarate reductase flavoprotein subunit [Ferrimonas marina]